MPAVYQIINIRRTRQLHEHSSCWARIGLLGGLFACLLILFIVGIGIGYYFYLVHDLPSVLTLPSLLEPPGGPLLQPTRLYDRTHEHVILALEHPSAIGRQYLTVSGEGEEKPYQFSENLVNATIVALDPGFWSEPGYSTKIFTTGRPSTLAERLVADILLIQEPASKKKDIQIGLLASQVTAQFGRQKVVEWFLNSEKYGEYIYGADAAARVFLGKSATQLTIAEAALLTAIAESPQVDPWQGGQLIRDRQVTIIQEMLGSGVIGEAEAKQALRENILLQDKQELQSPAHAFTSLALAQVSSQIPLEQLARGGFEITTTLDDDLQRQAACAAQEQLHRILGDGNQPSLSSTGGCEAATLLPALQNSAATPSSVDTPEVIVLEPQSGEILAYVGGENIGSFPGTPALHPAGTILFPFMYLTAFSQGMSPASMIWDLPQSGSSTITNKSLESFHGPARLRTAMVNDYSGAASQLAQMLGVDAIWETEKKFGITSLESGPSSATSQAVFSQSASLVEAVQAYGVLANQGSLAGQAFNAHSDKDLPSGLTSSTVLNVVGPDGATWLESSEAQVRPIVSDQLAYLTTDVLSDNKAHIADPSQGLLDLGRTAAVKVGLSSDERNAWTIGYIPQLTVGVWVGSSSSSLTAAMASGLWQAVMKYASSNLPVIAFAEPGGMNRVQVCDPSGLLVSPICPAVVEELFLKGTEPDEVDNLYQEYFISTQTGQLATIFTPAGQVEKKVFLDLPGEALAWAKAMGFPTPPQTYDDINALKPASSEVQISQPEMNEHLSGKIQFTGSAAGTDFSYYRLQVGQGLYPRQWLQIGEDVHQPVQDGVLGTWDTAGLNGEYIVELLVVRQDLRVERAFVALSIDNTPPQLQISSPNHGQHLTQKTGESILIQLDAADNLGLDRVEIYTDDVLTATLYGPPYFTAWAAEVGMHSLRVIAYDQAGNMTEAKSQFTIDR